MRTQSYLGESYTFLSDDRVVSLGPRESEALCNFCMQLLNSQLPDLLHFQA